MLLLLFLAQILVAVGWGPYFPLSVPALHIVAGWSPLVVLGLLLATLALVAVAGRHLDHRDVR